MLQGAGLLILLAALQRGQAATTSSPPKEYFCPDGWIDADVLGCFKFLDSSLNLVWVEAQQKCESIGGYLAEPTNERVAEFLHGVATVYETFSGINHWWIGLTDLGKEGQWVWSSSRTNLTQSFWGAQRPNTSYFNTDDCVAMVTQPDRFWWEDISCLTAEVAQNRVAPICQRDRIATASCPPGAEFDGHCYLLTDLNRATWQEAENYCILKGGHLASIHSKAEEEFIISLANGASGFLYLGGSDAVSEGNWVWTDGSAWDYTNWNVTQPDDANAGEDCLEFYVDAEDLSLWYDVPCDLSRNFICKL